MNDTIFISVNQFIYMDIPSRSCRRRMRQMDMWITWINRTLFFFCFLFTVNQGAAEIDELPSFTDTPINVTTTLGSEAVLRCGIENLGTKTVGWRKQPYTVPITVGKTQFLELDRFKLGRVLHLGEWNLHIKNAQMFDSGTYECQVSSKRNFIRRNVTLTVFDIPSLPSEPSIHLTGTQFAEKGTPIHLTCNATGGQDETPQAIDWFKDGRKLETSDAHKVYIQRRVSILENTLISSIDIDNARMSDTGVYVCRASKKLATRIKVDVLNAETYNEKRDAQKGEMVLSSSDGCCLICSKYASILTLFTTVLTITYLDSSVLTQKVINRNCKL